MNNSERRRNQRTKAIQEFGGKCVSCQSDDRLQFDHVNPATKKYRVRDLWNSKSKWLEEAPKLQLLCYKCHKAKTIQEQTKPLIHATTNAYNRKGCRCRVCRDFMNQRNRKYREARKQK